MTYAIFHLRNLRQRSVPATLCLPVYLPPWDGPLMDGMVTARAGVLGSRIRVRLHDALKIDAWTPCRSCMAGMQSPLISRTTPPRRHRRFDDRALALHNFILPMKFRFPTSLHGKMSDGARRIYKTIRSVTHADEQVYMHSLANCNTCWMPYTDFM